MSIRFARRKIGSFSRPLCTRSASPCPKARVAKTLDEAHAVLDEIGFPAILRPSFTLGGAGGGVAYNLEEFEQAMAWAFRQSPTHECLVEESVLGWKEFELEVIRDVADNFIVVCTIENFDPMGVHTGDSITVAPAMTLTDKEYQRLRDAGRAVISEIGVETGGFKYSVRHQPARWPSCRHRNESEGVAIECLGIQGNGVSDRQDRS